MTASDEKYGWTEYDWKHFLYTTAVVYGNRHCRLGDLKGDDYFDLLKKLYHKFRTLDVIESPDDVPILSESRVVSAEVSEQIDTFHKSNMVAP